MAADPLTSKPPSFAALAKRISAWTTNSLLTLIVLIAGVGFGRQVLTWWAANETPPGDSATTLSADPLGDPAQPHILEVGDNAWSLRRRTIVGDKNKAIEQLRADCRQVLEIGPSDEKSPSPPAPLRAPTEGWPGEGRFMDFLAGSTPVVQEPDKWRLYELHETFPMAVGLSRPNNAPVAPLPTPGNSEPSLAQWGYRVVIWGVAMPMGDRQWTLCTFQSGPPSVEGVSVLANIPLPPGGRRILSLSAAGGGIVTIRGPDRPADWKRFYDDWFSRRRWRQAANWQPAGDAWHAKFADSGGDSVDIRLGPDGRGGLSGLLMTTPGGSK